MRDSEASPPGPSTGGTVNTTNTRSIPGTTAVPRLRVFVSSPGDVAEERVLAARVIRRLADEHAARVWLEPVFWEHEPLLATDTFQSQIPRPSDCHVMVCVLWSRIGTRLPAKVCRPDGSPYASGTEYEFEDAVEGHKRNGRPDLLVYRKTADPTVSLKDKAGLLARLDQKERLDGFLTKWFHDAADGSLKAAFHSFETSAGFEELLEAHLRKLIARRLPRPVPSSAATAAPPTSKKAWTAGSPFRGLSPFEFEHAAVFFGRSGAVGDVLTALRKQAAAGRAFVLVLGASGSGKSSLARAGVVPLLAQPGVVEGVGLWRRAAFRPADSAAAGGDPFDALAAALLRPEALPELAADGTTAAALAGLLRENPIGAHLLAKGALAHAAAGLPRPHGAGGPPEARLALVADQLEELFTMDRLSAADRAAFVAALASLARGGRAWVVATLRSDFYARCAELPELIALKDGPGPGQYDLLPPTPAEIGQLVRRPASAAGLRFEADPQTGQPLDDVLRDAAAASPESLPLLQFALEVLYERRAAEDVLTHAAYRDLGGVEGALARRAEATFASLPPDVQASLPRVLRMLVAVGTGDDASATRRKAPLDEVTTGPAERALVEAFVTARLFVADLSDAARAGDASAASAVVSVAHEALLRHWPRLLAWLDADRELLRVRQRVSAAAARWAGEGRPADLLLPDGKPLAEARGLASAAGFELSANERELVAASSARAAGRRRLRRAAVSALAILAVAAGAAALYADRLRGRADANEKVATASAQRADEQASLAEGRRQATERNAEDAARRLSAVYARDGLARLDAGDPAAALPWLVRALEVAPPKKGDQELARTRLATVLRDAPRPLDVAWPGMYQQPYSDRTSDGRSVTFDYKEKLAQIVRVDNRGSRTVVATLQGAQDSAYGAEFSPDGCRVAAPGRDRTARVWDAATGQPLTPPLSHEGEVHSVRFSPDGLRVATASEDRTARVWDATTGRPVTLPLQHDDGVWSVAFSADGQRLATRTQDGVVRVWEAASGRPLTSPIRHEEGQLGLLAFSPDGRRLITATQAENRHWTWDVGTGKASLSPDFADNRPRRKEALADDELSHIAVWRDDDPNSYSPTQSQRFGVAFARFSPDGLRVALTDLSGAIRVWNRRAKGEGLTPPLDNGGPRIAQAGFSPDGQWLLTVSADNAARVWDATSGRPRTPPMRQGDPINSVVFSPDGRRLFIAGKDKTTRVWDATTGQPLSPPLRHAAAVTSVKWSPDGARVATAGEDRCVRVLDALTGRPLTPAMRHEGKVWSVDFSPDGKKVATASEDKAARVWDAATGALATPPLQHEAAVDFVGFSPDGRRIATSAQDNAARLWDAGTGQPISPPLRHEGPVTSIAFSRNAPLVATGSFDGSARVWFAATGQPVTPPLWHHGRVLSVLFSPEDRRLCTTTINDDDGTVEELRRKRGLSDPAAATAGTMPDADSSEDRAPRIWDVMSSGAVTTDLRHEGWVASVVFSPDGRRVVTASVDKTARVWDVATGRPVSPPLRHDGGVSSAVFSPDGRWVATASEDRSARVWDAESGDPVSPPLRHEGPLSSVAFDPDGRHLLTGSFDSTARVWDVVTGRQSVPPLQHGLEVLVAKYSPDGRRIATGSRDKTAQVWDAITGQPTTPPLPHESRVTSAAFSRDGGRLVVATSLNRIPAPTDTEGRTAWIWDAATGKSVTPPLRHGGSVYSAAFSPDGRFVVTASDDKTARVWDAATGQPTSPSLTHAGEVRSAAFSPDGRKVATASMDGTARVWDAETGQPVSPPLRLAGGVVSAAFSPDGQRLVTAGADLVARVWEIGPDDRPVADLRELAELLAGQRLDATDAVIRLTAHEWRERWDRLRERYPDEFRPRSVPDTQPSSPPSIPATRPAATSQPVPRASAVTRPTVASQPATRVTAATRLTITTRPAARAPAAPTSRGSTSLPFWYDYRFEPQAGPRHWSQVDATHWQERYPDGHAEQFEIVDRLDGGPYEGTVARHLPDRRAEVLIPPVEEGRPLRFRTVGQATWRVLGPIHLGPSPRPAATGQGRVPTTAPAQPTTGKVAATQRGR
jgi:WD40 repeat protein